MHFEKKNKFCIPYYIVVLHVFKWSRYGQWIVLLRGFLHTLLKLNITLHSRHILLYKYKLFNENTKQNQVKVSGNIKVGTTPSYCVMFDIYIHTLSIFGPHRKYVRQETFHSWLSLISYQRIFFALSSFYVEFKLDMLTILYNLVYL